MVSCAPARNATNVFMFRNHWLEDVFVLVRVGKKADKFTVFVLIVVNTFFNGKERGQSGFAQNTALSHQGEVRSIQTGAGIGDILVAQAGKNTQPKQEKEIITNAEFVGGNTTKVGNCQAWITLFPIAWEGQTH